MKKALVVGGNSGIGLAVTINLIKRGYSFVYIVGKDALNMDDVPYENRPLFCEHTSFSRLNLIAEDYNIFDDIRDINTLVLTAGFGRVAPFKELTEAEITNGFKCNEIGIIRIIKKYYEYIKSEDDFYCAVMGSIAGHVASPLFSVYGASKTGLCAFVENINIELAAQGYSNRILDVSPGSVKGTHFNGGNNDISQVKEIADAIVSRMLKKEMLYIPQYNEVYKDIIERYRENPLKFGVESYDYKKKSGRMSTKPQVTVGYLSGTFDLFHIGHLNLLRRAKEECDYLIVGVHKSGAWKGKETFIPFEERMAIVGNIKYVDKVVESFIEDSDAYEAFHYDKLFVGSDYKGTERFNRYEKLFEGKGVQIVYFPYTNGTSSTQIRNVIKMEASKK